MEKALNSTGRRLFYSISNQGKENVQLWAPATANSWRVSTDMKNTWTQVRYNFQQALQFSQYAGSGSWNDPDFLIIGNGNLTSAEERTHFALWAFLKAPLILSTNLANLSPEALATVGNWDLIALNQDSYGEQCYCVMNCNSDL